MIMWRPSQGGVSIMLGIMTGLLKEILSSKRISDS